MIEYIKGELAEVTPAQAVVDCHGVGYGISISLNTFSEIQGKKEVKLWIYEAIREDAHQLLLQNWNASCLCSSSVFRALEAIRRA